MKIYLDLDRTLFRTSVAAELIWRTIALWYPRVNVEYEATRQSEFYRFVTPDSYYYDMASHFRSCGLDPIEIAGRLVTSQIADNRLLLDGAAELVEGLVAAGNDVAILSFGSEYYQRLKAALCPVLAGLPIYVTQKPKGIFLADKGECVMVDDKDIAHQLPSNVRFIWVQVEGTSISRDTHEHAVTSLYDVASQIESM